jgi:hypothetical protein
VVATDFLTMVDSYYAMKALIAENKRISVMNFKLALARYQVGSTKDSIEQTKEWKAERRTKLSKRRTGKENEGPN